MKSNKTKVAVFCDWYLPGYKAGGPIRSVANLVGRLDLDFYVITSDRDWGAPSAFEGVTTDSWTTGPQGENVLYLSTENQNVEYYKSVLKELNADAIYLNSLFSPPFALRPLKAIRQMGLQSITTLAPRGMLKSGAIAQKGLKKKVFLACAKFLRWYDGIFWHATNSVEAEEIKTMFGDVPVKIAPNLIKPIDSNFTITAKQPGQLHIVTIARISPEKNTLNAIKLLKDLSNDADIKWDLYGSYTDQSYFDQCVQLANSYQMDISFKGEIEHQEIPSVLRDVHAMYLPTLGENYGHSIVESFVSGTPVVISNKTPWRNLDDSHAGWDLSLESGQFASIVARLKDMNSEEYSEFCSGAFELGKTIANNELDLQKNYQLFSHD